MTMQWMRADGRRSLASAERRVPNVKKVEPTLKEMAQSRKNGEWSALHKAVAAPLQYSALGTHMPESSIDIDKLSLILRNNAKPHSIGRCAHYVRLALEAGGAKTTGHPAHAKDWGGILSRNRYQKVGISSLASYFPQPGDVAIIQPCAGGSISGHIQIWDGRRWISDFVQHDFWPGPGYRKSKPSFAI